MAARNQQKHQFLMREFIRSGSAPVRVELIKIKIIFILRQGMSPAKCASRKSLEIQASSVAKRRTLSYRKFV